MVHPTFGVTLQIPKEQKRDQRQAVARHLFLTLLESWA